MAVEQIDLELIHDNPYQARLTYHRQDIDGLAHSIKTHGLLQVPPGRRKDGNVELGFGHLRKRAFAKLAKKEPERWGKMPVDIQDLSDEQMALFALEENLKRRDITPMETARAVDHYLNSFLKKTETELAEYLNMTKGNVSNMRRVLRLPEKILEKIDNGVISFTQGRELLTLGGLENAEDLMASALGGLRTGNKAYGHSNTVEGLQVSIHEIISRHYRPLDKEWEGYRWDLLFDTRAAGCLQCDKMIRSHPSKSQAAHYCTNEECWDRHDKEHREKAAAAAKAQMEADILRRTAGKGELIPEVPGKIETYRIQNLLSRQWHEGESTSVDAACYAAGWNKEDCWVRVRTERGGWSNVFGHMPTTPPPVVINESGHALPVPCETCANADSCDRSYFHVALDGSDQLVCEQKVKRSPEELEREISRRIASAPAPPPQEIPEDLLEKAKVAAGTRAEVLDLRPLYTDDWRHELKGGFVNLGNCLNEMDDPGECLERCTQGFHYAFDSKFIDRAPGAICTDPKCVSKKKAALTRKRNAEGQVRKKAEVKAIKEAIAQTTTLDRPRINLILLAQIDGLHASKTYYYGAEGGVKRPEKWLWDKVSAGVPENDRTRAKLFKAIDKLSDEELAKLVVEFMFYYLTDKGDIGGYEIKATEPLKWLGIAIKVEPGGNKDHA